MLISRFLGKEHRLVEAVERFASGLRLHDDPAERLSQLLQHLASATQTESLQLEVVVNDEKELYGDVQQEEPRSPSFRTIIWDGSNQRITLIHQEQSLADSSFLPLIRALAISCVEQIQDGRNAETQASKQLLELIELSLGRSDVKDFHATFTAFLGLVRSRFDAKYVSLWLVDEGYLFTEHHTFEKRRILVATATSEIDRSELVTEILPITDSNHVLVRTIKSGAPQLYKDIVNNPNYRPNALAIRLGLKDLYCIPITTESGRVVGVLNVYSSTSFEMDPSKSALAVAVSAFLSEKIQELQLRERSELLESISRLTIDAPAPDQPASWSTFMQHVAERTGVLHAVLITDVAPRGRPGAFAVIASTAGSLELPAIRMLIEELAPKVPKQKIVRLPNIEGRSLGGTSDAHSLQHSAIFVPVGQSAVLVCSYKARSGCFDFLSEVEESAFAHLGEFINIYLSNSELLNRYRAAEEAKDVYLQNLRHEIISPLDFILSDADWLARRVSVKDEREATRITRVREQIWRNGNIITMLAMGSNAFDANFTLSPTIESLMETVIRPIRKFFENEARKYGGTLNVGHLGLPKVAIDPGYTMAVLYNLLRNAIKYRDPAESQLMINIESREASARGRVAIAVSDNGIGVAEGDQQRIFDKYFRGENALGANITGSGLGLAIARKIMEAQGGSIYLGRRAKPTEFILEFRSSGRE